MEVDDILVFVIYDIADNLTRSSFVKILQHYGLRRIQKSAFCGFLSLEERLNLADEFNFFISSERDSIILIPTCDSYLDAVFIEGNLILPQKWKYAYL